MQPIHTYSATHKLYLISVREFLGLPVKNWRYNRQPDRLRCNEIATHIVKTRIPLENMFYLAKNGPHYEVLDGIHRYTALKIIAESVDYTTDSVMATTVLLNVRYDATDGELIDLFMSLNKSVPVPELYMRDPDQIRREAVEIVVKRWQTRYPDHFSPARIPKKPHMNRDAFVEVVDGMVEKFMVDDMIDVDRMERALGQLNAIVQEEWAARETPRTAIEKCRRTGFWLFLLGADAIVERV
jgi:hypothetical protein